MLKYQLKKLIKGDVEDDPPILDRFSRDASLFEVRPEVVVSPKEVEDIKNVVKFVSEEKKKNNPNISITARSAGTDMSGGPLNDSIILSLTKYFNHVKEVGESEGGGYIVTEPGVFYRDFELETLKKDLLLPPYPASREICTVGGMVSNNSGGEKTLAYGKTEDFVLELKVVLADGNEYVIKPLTKTELVEKIKLNNFEGRIYSEIFHLVEDNYEKLKSAKPNVTKNSAGYFLWNVWDKTTFDLTKLIVGSQGTLGIVTEIKFRLVRTKKHDRLAVIFMKDLTVLPALVNTVLKYKPENFESYDDQTLKLGIKYFRDIIKILKPKNAIKLALSFLPEFFAGLWGGLPKLILLVEFTGDDTEEIAKRMADLEADIEKFPVKFHLTKSDEEEKKYWTFRRESFNLLRHHLSGKRTAPFIDDIVVRPEVLPEFLPRLNKILKQYPIFYTVAGHMGDANFHIIPLMNMADPNSKNIILKLSDEVYDLVIEYKGSITGEHNDGIIRTPYLEKMYGKEIYDLFRKVKNTFDPQNIFNPRKKVGLPGEGADDKTYLADHLITRN